MPWACQYGAAICWMRSTVLPPPRPAGAAAGTAANMTDPVGGLRLALAHAPEGQPLWVVGTYQALWQLRDWMRRQRLVNELWEA